MLKNIGNSPTVEKVKTTGLAGLIAVVTFYGEFIKTELKEVRTDQVEILEKSTNLRVDVDDLQKRIENLEEMVL